MPEAPCPCNVAMILLDLQGPGPTGSPDPALAHFSASLGKMVQSFGMETELLRDQRREAGRLRDGPQPAMAKG